MLLGSINLFENPGPMAMGGWKSFPGPYYMRALLSQIFFFLALDQSNHSHGRARKNRRTQIGVSPAERFARSNGRYKRVLAKLVGVFVVCYHSVVWSHLS